MTVKHRIIAQFLFDTFPIKEVFQLKFSKLYFNEFYDNPYYKISFQLWVEYHCLTERYDRNLPHFPSYIECSDSVFVNPQYRDISTQYANKIMNVLKKMEQNFEIDKELSSSANRDVCRFGFDRICEFYKGFDNLYLQNTMFGEN